MRSILHYLFSKICIFISIYAYLVTECEVDEGILHGNQPSYHTLAYVRGLEGLSNNKLNEKNATRFIDAITKDGKVGALLIAISYCFDKMS